MNYSTTLGPVEIGSYVFRKMNAEFQNGVDFFVVYVNQALRMFGVRAV